MCRPEAVVGLDCYRGVSQGTSNMLITPQVAILMGETISTLRTAEVTTKGSKRAKIRKLEKTKSSMLPKPINRSKPRPRVGLRCTQGLGLTLNTPKSCNTVSLRDLGAPEASLNQVQILLTEGAMILHLLRGRSSMMRLRLLRGRSCRRNHLAIRNPLDKARRLKLDFLGPGLSLDHTWCYESQHGRWMLPNVLIEIIS